MIGNRWEQVLVQTVNNVGPTCKAPVLLLGFSPRELSSYVLKETCTRVFIDGYIACSSKNWKYPKCQRIRIWYINTTEYCMALEKNGLS